MVFVRFGFADLHEARLRSGGAGHLQHRPALVALQQRRGEEQQRRGLVQTAAGEGEHTHTLPENSLNLFALIALIIIYLLLFIS